MVFDISAFFRSRCAKKESKIESIPVSIYYIYIYSLNWALANNEVKLAEWSKAPDLSSGTRKCAWVQTPHLTNYFLGTKETAFTHLQSTNEMTVITNKFENLFWSQKDRLNTQIFTVINNITSL